MYASSGEPLAYFSYTSTISKFGVVQVGQLPKQGDKLNKSGALKSMADVLEVCLPEDSHTGAASTSADSVVNERPELEKLNR